LTQEQLAERLGIRGGKPVISGWETGRASCEGPAAELLLHLLGRGSVSFDVSTLDQELSAIWTRTKNPVEEWRQVLAVPEEATRSDAATFVSLFPQAALDDGRHGFPFVARGLPSDVYGITQSGWLGCIPQRADVRPTYLWTLTRNARFGYREHLWEVDQMSSTRGQIDVGSMLNLALEATHFIRGLSARCSFGRELRFILQLDLHGARGRRLVEAPDPWGPDDGSVALWNEDHATAATSATVEELTNDPLAVGIELVVEFAAQINPAFASSSALMTVLENRAKRGNRLAFLDDKRLR